MANKYSKSNNSTKAAEARTMQEYEKRRQRINTGAKIMAIILIGAMVVFYVISAGLFLMD
jgi:predicted nucleic acid-binding Zn ribbon protein